jgi:hypothetical protein
VRRVRGERDVVAQRSLQDAGEEAGERVGAAVALDRANELFHMACVRLTVVAGAARFCQLEELGEYRVEHEELEVGGEFDHLAGRKGGEVPGQRRQDVVAHLLQVVEQGLGVVHDVRDQSLVPGVEQLLPPDDVRLLLVREVARTRLQGLRRNNALPGPGMS